MSSQTSIPRDVDIQQNALGADAPGGASEVKSSDPARANPVPEMIR
jgi:hypothetical protein